VQFILNHPTLVDHANPDKSSVAAASATGSKPNILGTRRKDASSDKNEEIIGD
jgi:hypothetical protein